MLSYILSAALALTVSSASAQSLTVPSCLQGYTGAAAACGSLLPTITETTTTTTSVLSVATSVTTQHAAEQVTVNATTFQTTTVTITAGPTATVTSIATFCSDFNTTLTTYTDASATAARRVRRASITSACQATGLASLIGLADGALSSACSFLSVAQPTITLTSYITVVSSSTTTAVSGTPSTTTLYELDHLTITETVTPEPVTFHFSTTTSSTSTRTITLVAPTFDQVYGPSSGCADVATGPAQTLDARIVNMDQAVEDCKEICKQQPKCKALFVQHMFTDYGRASPYFECYMNEQDFNSTSLQCGKRVGTYGEAVGFDACGRGQV